ncbi:RluA family pseudouridine synthase [Candidatus Liberibacter sp.]|uniref:RluA family pseudouridine synthase n=1 Tax=Candidatus Liberibacter sp. TaxID=34022 RepID=UPI0015F594B3|nr:RluA family pseudouridine synthase [Candidatus Liberibacter sp.]MBA5723676.1 RluA family pseudouridine synthase [Candidatus Liberibacter sp.]
MLCVQHIIIDSDEGGMRFDRWFRIHYPHISFGNLQKLLRSGQIRLDKGRIKSNDRVQPGQIVRIPPVICATSATQGSRFDQSKNYSDSSEFLKRILLYENSKIYVFNKPPGIPVQGGSGITRHIDGMLESWTNLKGEKPRLIHRLDRETSGILIVARTRAAAQSLTESFRMRRVRKVYWSLVKGIPKQSEGRLSSWLMKSRQAGGDYVKVVEQNEDGANHAISCYKVIDTFEQQFCWLEMQPHTGRTHQLRVQALQMGHPIIGDKKYYIEDHDDNFLNNIPNQLHLHARYIDFPYPEGGRLQMTAPLPSHMAKTWDLCGFKYGTDMPVE